jgi:hypothetical protein
LECGGSTPLSFFAFPERRSDMLKKEREKKESGVEPPHSKAPKQRRAALHNHPAPPSVTVRRKERKRRRAAALQSAAPRSTFFAACRDPESPDRVAGKSALPGAAAAWQNKLPEARPRQPEKISL